MLSINTDLSGLIIQNSMTSSTAKLNQAIERMSTGYKINHAKDNAANYSINTEMTSKLGAYNVAADNVSMGIDLLATASDTISQMQTRGERLRSLIVQSRNGTYGAQSLESMQTEAMSLVSEITRLYTTSNYNQIDLFTNTPYDIAEHLPQASPTGFINPNTSLEVRDDGFILDPVEYSKTQVDNMITVTKAYNDGAFEANKEYSVSNLDELQKLAGMVNSGIDTTNVTFVLAGDIDLESIANWTPIGTETNMFKGKFNGNGHVIKNLKIKSNTSFQGLFGVTASGSEIKNLGVTDVNLKVPSNVGALVG
ncbi:flagellin [bacterium]|nr:flagellin [bacterium]